MLLDIFDNEAFSMVTMSSAIERKQFLPQRLDELNIFTNDYIRTQDVAVEDRSGQLRLIKTSARGAPLEQRKNTKSAIRKFSTVRLGKGDRILASELAFLREFGTEDQIRELRTEIARRLGGGMNGQGLIDDVRLTLENMRLGAIQGKVLDADGSIIIDWTQEFSATPVGNTAWDLAASDGSFREQCVKHKRNVIRKSYGMFTNQSSLVNFCGDNFYDTLIKSPEVRQTYLNQEQAYYVAGGDAFDSFRYGGMVWENFRGTDDSQVRIDDDECVTFPTEVPGLFMEVFSPGEKFSDIGQVGREIYVETVPDMKRDSYVDLDVYSYPLHVTTNTAVLNKGTIKA